MRPPARVAPALAALVALGVAVALPARSVAAGAPTATTGPTTSVAATVVGVSGTVNPNGISTTYAFQYGATTAYGSQTATVSAGAGTSAIAATATISGLTSDTTYHYRLVATNASGPTDGADASFTTAKAPPLVTTGGAAVTGTAAVLSATVNPQGKATNYQFQYGTSTGYGQQSAATSAGSGTTAANVNATVSGLTPGVTYHYRVIATNPDGTATGADAIFHTTGSAPAVATGPPTSVTGTSVTLRGQVNPGGRAASYSFEYGPTTAYGSQTAYADAGAGTKSTTVSATITGLAPGTAYHYRLVATSSLGPSVGADATVETTAGAVPAGAALPAVSGATAVAIAATAAQLNGAINPPAAHTSWWFQLGVTSAYGLRTSTQTMSGLGARPINVRLAGLAPATTFHFRLVAQTSTTTYYGPDATFTTKAATRLPAAGLTVTAAAHAGRGNATVAVSGALTAPTALAAGAACDGTVEIQVLRGADTISLRSAAVRPDCTYGERVTFARRRFAGARRLGIAVHFTGNAVLLPTATRRTTVRI